MLDQERWLDVFGRVRRKAVASRLRQNAWLVTGRERHSGLPLRVGYLGHAKDRDFFCGLAFGEVRWIEPKGKVWCWPFKHDAPFPAPLSVTESTRLTRRWVRADYHIPLWINGSVDLDAALDRCARSGNIREDLRRIRRHGLSYEVTRDEQALWDFYQGMYVPYISRVYGDTAALIGFSQIRRRKDRCELLRVRHRDDPVAGEILLYGPNGGVRAWGLGVKGGDLRYLKMGAGAALYYFKILHLKEQGFRELDVGACRAFLNDGVLQFKRKWGMRLTGSRGVYFSLAFDKEDPGAKAFLRYNPFIHEDRGELFGAVFDPQRDPAGYDIDGVARVGVEGNR